MTGSTLAILIVIAVVVLIAVGIAMFMMLRNRLRPLSDEARDRYAQSWSAIESRFIEEPAAAVQEADQLVLAILRDRGARIDDERRLPREVTEARAAAHTNEGQSGTEGLRKAMLHYQHAVESSVGQSMRNRNEMGRKEMAS
jgi:hypothetical protein